MERVGGDKRGAVDGAEGQIRDGGEGQILEKGGKEEGRSAGRRRQKWKGEEDAEIEWGEGRGGNDGAVTVDAERTQQSRPRPAPTHLSRSQRPCEAEWSHSGVRPQTIVRRERCSATTARARGGST